MNLIIANILGLCYKLIYNWSKKNEMLYKRLSKTTICKKRVGKSKWKSEIVDKMLGIMKLWVEVGYFHNYTFIKTINSIYQDRFKRFLNVEDIDEIKNKAFYLDLLREYYIYIKEHLVEENLEYFFKYFTKEELEEFREEIKILKNNPERFLK